jgi:hypothetical protein
MPQSAPTKRSRGKYITLALLVAWVIGVFVFTLLKFSGGK